MVSELVTTARAREVDRGERPSSDIERTTLSGIAGKHLSAPEVRPRPAGVGAPTSTLRFPLSLDVEMPPILQVFAASAAASLRALAGPGTGKTFALIRRRKDALVGNEVNERSSSTPVRMRSALPMRATIVFAVQFVLTARTIRLTSEVASAPRQGRA